MKKYFLTGLAVLLPIVITFWVIALLVNILTNPFQNFVEEILRFYGLADMHFLIFSSQQVLKFLSKFLILVTLFFSILFIGLLGRMFVTHYVLKWGDYVMHNIPLVNKIYKATQDVVHSLLASNGQAFTQVVLVPFPHKKTYSVGLITSQTQHKLENSKMEDEMLSVFVPATPNPTMGFVLLLKRCQLVFLDMKVDDALKAIISCGVIWQKLEAGSQKPEERSLKPEVRSHKIEVRSQKPEVES